MEADSLIQQQTSNVVLVNSHDGTESVHIIARNQRLGKSAAKAANPEPIRQPLAPRAHSTPNSPPRRIGKKAEKEHHQASPGIHRRPRHGNSVRSEEERGGARSWGKGAYGDDVAVAPGEDVAAAEDGAHRVHELADVRVHAAALPSFSFPFPRFFEGWFDPLEDGASFYTGFSVRRRNGPR